MKYSTNDVLGSKSCVILEPYLGFGCLAFLSSFIALFSHDLHVAISVGSLVLGNTVISSSTICRLWIKTSHLIPKTTLFIPVPYLDHAQDLNSLEISLP